MVLQREPESAIVFGFDAFLTTSQAFVSCSENGVQLDKLSLVVEVEEDGSWRAEIPPQAGGSECDLTVVNGDELSQEEIHLKQVNFNFYEKEVMKIIKLIFRSFLEIYGFVLVSQIWPS
jgi:hypothetical protein